jgi:hypothetical protein
MVLFYLPFAILQAVAIALTNPKKVMENFEKQDERRYMPKEMLKP